MKKFLITAAAVALAPFALAQEKVEIAGDDKMQFDKKEFTVTSGEEVTLVLKHVGQLPAIAMGHNVLIVKPGTQLLAIAAKAATAKDSNYIPQDEESKEQIFAHTKMIGGGETDEITFTAPEPGDPYFCSFPGHFALMQGVMIVKAKE